MASISRLVALQSSQGLDVNVRSDPIGNYFVKYNLLKNFLKLNTCKIFILKNVCVLWSIETNNETENWNYLQKAFSLLKIYITILFKKQIQLFLLFVVNVISFALILLTQYLVCEFPTGQPIFNFHFRLRLGIFRVQILFEILDEIPRCASNLAFCKPFWPTHFLICCRAAHSGQQQNGLMVLHATYHMPHATFALLQRLLFANC